jgi:hypothetical protein
MIREGLFYSCILYYNCEEREEKVERENQNTNKFWIKRLKVGEYVPMKLTLLYVLKNRFDKNICSPFSEVTKELFLWCSKDINEIKPVTLQEKESETAIALKKWDSGFPGRGSQVLKLNPNMLCAAYSHKQCWHFLTLGPFRAPPMGRTQHHQALSLSARYGTFLPSSTSCCKIPRISSNIQLSYTREINLEIKQIQWALPPYTPGLFNADAQRLVQEYSKTV